MNLGKHGVTFETACEIFFDPFVLAVNEQQAAGEFHEAIISLTAN